MFLCLFFVFLIQMQYCFETRQCQKILGSNLYNIPDYSRQLFWGNLLFFLFCSCSSVVRAFAQGAMGLQIH